MINGWSIPAIAFAVVSQAAAAIWWASDTNTKVERNTTAIEQVVENEKEIAVVQMQQQVSENYEQDYDDNNRLLASYQFSW
jgi:hypothetical protein